MNKEEFNMENDRHWQRVDHIDGRVTTLDQRVNTLQSDVSAIKQGMDGMAKSMDTLIHRITTPKETNWIGIGSLILALMVGGAGWLQVRLAPVEADTEAQYRLLDKHTNILLERGEYIAGTRVELDHLDRGDKYLHERIKTFEDRLDKLESQATANAVAQEYTHDSIDYLRKHHDTSLD